MSGTAAVTRTGFVVDLLAPDPRAIRMTEIALSLSRMPRFAGHTTRSWSVADHSLLVADLLGEDAPPELALAGLLHDAHEAYALGDITTPALRALDAVLPGAGAAVAQIKRSLDGAVAASFGLDPALFMHEAVRVADATALAIEVHHLMAKPPSVWSALPHLPDFIPDLPKTDQDAAQNRFLKRALELLRATRRSA